MNTQPVFVLNQNKQPLDPTNPVKARKLLKKQKAVIHKYEPFTIRLKELKEPDTRNYRLKIDYGSRYTGLAVLSGNDVIWLGQLHHRTNVSSKVQDRAMYRGGRRSRKTRYRQPRFLNRTRPRGWVPPSLQARVDNIESIVFKLVKYIPITKISYEMVKFDTQLMNNPDIKSVEYQQGTLWGYEVREYLLEKFQRRCMYCNIENVPLQIEHIYPRSKGGSNRIDNLGLACQTCNQEKGSHTLEEWSALLSKTKKKRNLEIVKNIKNLNYKLNRTLKDVAVVNATRFRILEVLRGTGLDVETGTGARTKMNRIELGLPKDHHFDAICVGESTPKALDFRTSKVAFIKGMGRGNRKTVIPDKYGFPKSYRSRNKVMFGFQTGDIVKAVVPKGKYKGTHKGRVTVRKQGAFAIKDMTGNTLVNGSSYKYFGLLQRSDGYAYENRSLEYIPT